MKIKIQTKNKLNNDPSAFFQKPSAPCAKVGRALGGSPRRKPSAAPPSGFYDPAMIRGGLSQISKRYAKANNKYMSSYDKAKDDSYILYLDANNLYGASMSGYLPKSDFKWNEATWSSQIVQELDDEGDKGYLLEVDIHYPKELHDLHNGYACCPENMTIKK